MNLPREGAWNGIPSIPNDQKHERCRYQVRSQKRAAFNGKRTALFTIRRLMTKTCLSLVLWVPGLFLILTQVRQAVGSHWTPPLTGKTNQIQYLRLPEPQKYIYSTGRPQNLFDKKNAHSHIWNYDLARSHFMLYIPNYGRWSIVNKLGNVEKYTSYLWQFWKHTRYIFF